jgi:hypothetical protein
MRILATAAAVIAGAACLSGCAVYEVASTAVDVTTTVVSTTVDVAGAVITAPFGHDHSDKKSKSD